MTLLPHQILIFLAVIGVLAGCALGMVLASLRRLDRLNDRVAEVEAWSLLLERRLNTLLQPPRTIDTPEPRRPHLALGIIEEEPTP